MKKINVPHIKENPPWMADLGAEDMDVHMHRPVTFIKMRPHLFS
jgi:hypothetical protein